VKLGLQCQWKQVWLALADQTVPQCIAKLSETTKQVGRVNMHYSSLNNTLKASSLLPFTSLHELVWSMALRAAHSEPVAMHHLHIHALLLLAAQGMAGRQRMHRTEHYTTLEVYHMQREARNAESLTGAVNKGIGL